MEEVKIMMQDEATVSELCPRCNKIVDGEHKCNVPIVHEIVIDDSINITEKL